MSQAEGRSRPALHALGFAGIALTLVGLLSDIAYHLATEDPSLTVACCGPGFVGHIVTLAGMALGLGWVIGVALATRRDALDERRS